MKILNSIIENDPNFRIGYNCAIDDLKVILENVKILNPSMGIIELIQDWEKLVGIAQKKICNEKEN